MRITRAEIAESREKAKELLEEEGRDISGIGTGECGCFCSKENVSLRSLVEKMFRDGIRSYESKHGVAEGASKRTAEDLY